MKFYNSQLFLIGMSWLLCAVTGEETFTYLQVLPSDRASLFTQSLSTTASRNPDSPTASIDLDITPIGTAESGSETTYSYHLFASNNLEPASGDIQPYTVEGILVQSASGYREQLSQVFDPTSSGTVTAGVISGNCTFNEDGSGVCLQTEAGKPSSTATLTGTVVPIFTDVFDADNNQAAGLGLRVNTRAWLIICIIIVLMIGV